MKIFQHKEFQSRLGLLKTDKRKYLHVCDDHEMELTSIEYPWITQQGITKYDTAEMKLPVNIKDPPNRTRFQNRIRKEPPTKNNHEKIKRKPRQPNHENDAQYYGKICCVADCNTQDRGVDNNVKFQRIPCVPKISDHKLSRNSLLMDYYCQKTLNMECINRLNLNDCCFEDIRICNKPYLEKVNANVEWLDTKGRKQTVEFIMNLPNLKPNTRENLGVGNDRRNSRENDSNNNNNNSQSSSSCNNNNSHISTSNNNNNNYNNNRNIRPLFNLNKISYEIIRITASTIKKPYYSVYKEIGEQNQTTLRFDDLSDVMIKATTGFTSITGMMGFIIIACNADYKKMITTHTHLTWLEEWMLYFEIVWGKSCQRYIDVQLKYKTSTRTIR
jgi:hypothetical protein